MLKFADFFLYDVAEVVLSDREFLPPNQLSDLSEFLVRTREICLKDLKSPEKNNLDPDDFKSTVAKIFAENECVVQSVLYAS